MCQQLSLKSWIPNLCVTFSLFQCLTSCSKTNLCFVTCPNTSLWPWEYSRTKVTGSFTKCNVVWSDHFTVFLSTVCLTQCIITRPWVRTTYHWITMQHRIPESKGGVYTLGAKSERQDYWDGHVNGVNLCIGVCVRTNFYLNVRAASSPGQSKNSEQS